MARVVAPVPFFDRINMIFGKYEVTKKLNTKISKLLYVEWMYVYTLNKYSHANNMNTYKVENIQVITTSQKEKQWT